MMLALGLLSSPMAATTPPAMSTATAPAREPDIAGAFIDPRLKSTHRMSANELAAFVEIYRLEVFLPRTGRATVPVSNCNDSGPGSLRAAMVAAVSGDTVDARNLTCSTITLTSGQIAFSANALVFTGPGRDRLTVRNGAGDGLNNRIFVHAGTGTFQIGAVTLADGRVIGTQANPRASGGCVNSNGTVSLGNPLTAGTSKYSATVQNCRAIAVNDLATGGAIQANRVIVTNSRVINNEAGGSSAPFGLFGGGGVAGHYGVSIAGSEFSGNRTIGSKYGGGAAAIGPHSGTGDNIVVDSTITGNHANAGGGLSVLGNTRIVNSTISGNTSSSPGAGILVGTATGQPTTRLELFSSTVTGNILTSGDHGGGVYLDDQTVLDMRSSIISGNQRNTSVANDLGGQGNILGNHNLIGTSTAAQPVPVGTVITDNPRLWPLAYNGGRTRTHALRADSPAINRGSNPNAQPNDQRGAGFPRLIGLQPDIGAFEFNPVQADWLFVDGFQ